jgi:endonuclease-3
MSRMLIKDFNGEVPNKLEELEKLPGVGRKTANVILAVGYNIPAFPVDTHLIRMSHRLGYAKQSDTVLEIEKKYTKYIDKEEWNKAHHLLLLFGRYHCKAVNPKCNDCKLIKFCKVK